MCVAYAFQNPRYIQTHIYCNPVENAPPLHGAAHIRRGKTRDARALLPLEGGVGLPACLPATARPACTRQRREACRPSALLGQQLLHGDVDVAVTGGERGFALLLLEAHLH